MPSIFDTMRVVFESYDPNAVTSQNYPNLFAKVQRLRNMAFKGKMSLQGNELVELVQLFNKIAPGSTLEGNAILPGFEDVELERVGNNYYIKHLDVELENAKKQLEKKLPEV